MFLFFITEFHCTFFVVSYSDAGSWELKILKSGENQMWITKPVQLDVSNGTIATRIKNKHIIIIHTNLKMLEYDTISFITLFYNNYYSNICSFKINFAYEFS